jgi:hypothetical protein
MDISFPNASEKEKLLHVAKNQNYMIYLGRKFAYINPKIYDVMFNLYRNFRMIRFFGIKRYLFGVKQGNVDFLIAGFPKSGTTSLHEYLLEHTSIFSSWIKEPHFFSYGYTKDMDQYLKNFRFHKNSLHFESSTDYIYHPESFKRIKRFNPNMKIIICLRNPVEQVFSHYNHQKQVGLELDSFEDAISKEHDKKRLHLQRLEKNIYNDQKIAIDIPYLYFGEYVTHVKRALEVFDFKNLFFVDSRELMTNTQQTVNEIFRFLGLETVEISMDMHNKREYKDKMSKDTRNKLFNYFAPYNEQLEKLLKRKFNWT